LLDVGRSTCSACLLPVEEAPLAGLPSHSTGTTTSGGPPVDDLRTRQERRDPSSPKTATWWSRPISALSPEARRTARSACTLPGDDDRVTALVVAPSSRLALVALSPLKETRGYRRSMLIRFNAPNDKSGSVPLIGQERERSCHRVVDGMGRAHSNAGSTPGRIHRQSWVSTG